MDSMTAKIDVYSASDYAGITVNNVGFYYGYEQFWCPQHGFNDSECKERDCEDMEWCFRAKVKGEVTLIPYHELAKLWSETKSEQWDCRGNLLVGIAFMIAKMQGTIP